ncbi:MAG TPA: PstS family phosphate ABC transporter substrate-binding protein [Rhodothermales bacterium]
MKVVVDASRYALIVITLTMLAACGGERRTTDSELTGTVVIDGSSTLYPITEAVGEEFFLQHPGVRVPIGVSGTGGGFSKFLRGEIDINDASRPIKPSEVTQAEENGIEFIELPVAYDGLAVVVNPAADWVDCLTVEELRRIWEPNSSVRSWSQVRAGFPDRQLELYGPGTDSGTYDYFTEAIVGEEGASRADFAASEDDNVLVQGIVGDENALGFFGMAYYEENRTSLKLLGIDDGNGENGEGCVRPTAQTVRDGTYQPLSRPLFIYVRSESADRPVVRAFVQFYLENAPVLAQEVGYVPMTDRAYQLALRRFESGVVGTMLGAGVSQVGANIEELMAGTAADTMRAN